MHQRSLAPGRAAGSQGDDGRQCFDRGDFGTDLTALVVKGVDHCFGSGTLGFGSEAVSQVATDQAAQRRQQEQDPQMFAVGGCTEKGKIQDDFAPGMVLPVSGEIFDQQEFS